jgi:hypothetical protein
MKLKAKPPMLIFYKLLYFISLGSLAPEAAMSNGKNKF